MKRFIPFLVALAAVIGSPLTAVAVPYTFTQSDFFSVGGLLFPAIQATLPSFPRIASHGREDEIPPTRQRVVLHL